MSQILANHHVLAVHDIESSARWFVDVLDFNIYRKPDGWIFVKRDNCMIMLGECKDSIPARDLGDHSYFAYLLVDDIDPFYDQAQSSQADIIMPLAQKPWGMKEFGLRMPEGHRIMVGQDLPS